MTINLLIEFIIWMTVGIWFVTALRMNVKMKECMGSWLTLLVGLGSILSATSIDLIGDLINIRGLLGFFKNLLYAGGAILFSAGMVGWTSFTSRTIAQLREDAMRDDLTGLYNRKAFFERLDLEIKMADRHGHLFDVIVMDVDNFKSVNDEFGHVVGDAVLKEIARILIEEIRESDMIARYGGDEFVAILTSSAVHPFTIMERIKERLAHSEFLKGKVQSISIGWATYPVDSTDKDKLLDIADKAMYMEKVNYLPLRR